MKKSYAAIFLLTVSLLFLFRTFAFSGEAGGASPLPQKAVIKGKVLGVEEISPGLLGLKEGTVFYRLVVLVEETEDVENSKNSLRDKEGESVTFFSDEKKTQEFSGKRIKALAEYKGSIRSRLFWLTHVELIE